MTGKEGVVGKEGAGEWATGRLKRVNGIGDV